MNEPNHHSRNLKVISVFFILYWLLELTPTGENEIRLQFISYEIHNPRLMMPIAWTLLLYFAFRFWLSSRGKFLKSLKSNQTALANTLLSRKLHHDQVFNDGLLRKAEEYYKEHLECNFEERRTAKKAHCKNTYKVSLSHSFKGFKYIGAQAVYDDRVESLYINNFKLPVSLYLIQIAGMIKSLIRVGFLYEEGPDYFWPWILFIVACISGLCINFDISVDALFSGPQQLDNAQVKAPCS